MRPIILAAGAAITALLLALAWFFPPLWLSFLLWGPVLAIGACDALQKGNTIRRNYPFFGTINALAEKQRHIPQEVALQTSWEGRPFSILQRRLVAKRAADELKNLPFGTETDYAAPGHDWLTHSAYPTEALDDDTMRVSIGGPACRLPYSASRLNISAMSYGSISSHAVLALADGAAIGHFALNTGEGGITDYHLRSGADLIWQIGTAYFGCRTPDGDFDPDAFRTGARREQVRMIEIKISQGAKPGFGAILPASKNTEEVARYRRIEPHKEVISPAGHKTFSNADQLLDFIERLRDLSGGKPVGIKLCLGQRDQFLHLCRRMHETDRAPDFITIDGGEGGSGAAALDSIHHVGCPAENAVAFAADALRGFNLNKQIRLLAAGKVISGADVVRYLALGADACYSARGMMFALGCVQSLKCNSNRCPTGITTVDPARVKGLVVEDKKQKVANYHRNTIGGVRELLRAAGLQRAEELGRRHIERRVGPDTIQPLDHIYPETTPGLLLHPPRETPTPLTPTSTSTPGATA